jgi:D-aspartate ligase
MARLAAKTDAAPESDERIDQAERCMRDNQPRDPVFILGARLPALGVLRSLAPKGVACWVCESHRLQATWSRFASYWRVPDPRVDEQRMIDRLFELARKVEGRPVLIPTADHYAQVLAHHRLELESRMNPCVAPSDVVELFVDKRRFYEWGCGHGLSCPEAAPASDSQLPFAPPFAVKPINFTDFLLTASKMPKGDKPSDMKFTMIDSETAWQAFRERHHSNLNQLLLQKYIRGTSANKYSVGIYANQRSQILGLFVGRTVRGYPARYGTTVLGQNDRVPVQVIDEVMRVVRDVGYTGIAEFEYRQDPVSGTFYLIEINPRCWSWIDAASMSKADIVWIAYRDLCGVSTEPVIDDEAPGSIKSVRVMSDMANVFWRYRRDDPTWLMTPRAWWRSLAAKKLALVEFARGDWLISLFCFALLLRDIIRNEH